MTTLHQPAILTIGQASPSLNAFLSGPIPWILLFLGLWVAFMIKGFKLAAKIREARETNNRLAAELRSAMDQQSQSLDSVRKTFASEKQRWRLQVKNRNNLLTDLNRRLAFLNEERTGLKTELRSKTIATETLRPRLEVVESEFDDLNFSLEERERELEKEKRRTIELENQINELEIAAVDKDRRIEILELDLTDKQGARQLLDEVDTILEKRDAEVNQLREEREKVRGDLESRVSELEWLLGERDGEIALLTDEKSQRETEITTLKGKIQDRDKLARRLGELEAALEERDTDLESRRKHCVEVENRVNELEIDNSEKDRTIAMLEEELAEKQGARQKLNEVDCEIEKRDSELNHLREEREQLRNELEHRVADFEALLCQQKTTLEQQKKDQFKLETSINELELVVKDKDQTISDLEKNLDENKGARRRVAELESEIRKLDEALASKDEEIYLLSSSASDKESREDKLLSLSGFLHKGGNGDHDLEIQSLAARGDSKGLFSQLESREQQHKKELQSLTREKCNLEAEIDTLQKENRQLSDSLNGRFDADMEALKLQLREKETEIEALRHESHKDDDTCAKLQEAQWFLGERDEELRVARDQVDELSHSLEALRRDSNCRITELEKILNDQNGDLKNLRSEKESLAEQLSNYGSQDRIQELEWLLGERDGQMEELRNDMWAREHHQGERIAELEWIMGEKDAELNHLRSENGRLHHENETKNKTLAGLHNGEHGTLIERIGELEWLLGERDADLNRLREESVHLQEVLAGKDRELADLYNNRGGRQERINELEWLLGERDGELNELRPQLHDKDSQIQALSEKCARLEEAVQQKSEPPAPEPEDIAELSPPEKDDLKKINGIGTVTEEKLNKLGIYHYRQIAEWTADEISEFAEQLSFKDRIGRDRWIEQAIDLHRRIHGETLTPKIKIEQDTQPESKKQAVITTDNAFENDPVKIDRLLGPVFNDPPREVDDLSKLNGITPRYVEMLNHFGVFQYKQIALWNTRHLKQFTMLLNVNGPGKIDLNHWTAEAAELHHKKYEQSIQMNPVQRGVQN